MNRPPSPAAPSAGDGFAALLDSAPAADNTAPSRPPERPASGDGAKTDARKTGHDSTHGAAKPDSPAEKADDAATPAGNEPPAAAVTPVPAATPASPAASATSEAEAAGTAAPPAELALAATGDTAEPEAAEPPAIASSDQTRTALAPGKPAGSGAPAIFAAQTVDKSAFKYAHAIETASGAATGDADGPALSGSHAVGIAPGDDAGAAAASDAGNDGRADTGNEAKTAAMHGDDAAPTGTDAARGKPDASAGFRAATEAAPPAATAPDAAQPGNPAAALPQPPLAAATSAAAPAPQVGMMAPAAAVPLAGLALHIAANARAGRSQFDIRLEPAELGRIDVRLSIDRHGTVTSHVVVEKAETLDLLRRDAPHLQRALDDAGLKTGNGGLQFSLRDQTPQQHDHGPARPQQRIVIADDIIAAEAAGRNYGRLPHASGGLDIRV